MQDLEIINSWEFIDTLEVINKKASLIIDKCLSNPTYSLSFVNTCFNSTLTKGQVVNVQKHYPNVDLIPTLKDLINRKQLARLEIGFNIPQRVFSVFYENYSHRECELVNELKVCDIAIHESYNQGLTGFIDNEAILALEEFRSNLSERFLKGAYLFMSVSKPL